MMRYRVKDLVDLIESHFPLRYQESYDNSGLIVGDQNMQIKGVLLSLDVTEASLEEAINKGYNVILSHHPFIFSAIKKYSGNSTEQRILRRAIKENIAIYAAHTSADSVASGVSGQLAMRLGVRDFKILRPQSGKLCKIAIFAPTSHAERLRETLFAAGVGKIGNYDSCSFNSEGFGTFRATECAKPYVGEIDKLHQEREIKIEAIVERALLGRVIAAAKSVHPYEEMAYDISALEINHTDVGLGVVGDLEEETTIDKMVEKISETLSLKVIRYTNGKAERIKRVAICGGSGADLTPDAIGAGADIFITGDVKYHSFLDYSESIILADIGHFESEEIILDHFHDIVTKKMTTFAVAKAENRSNPIKYYTTL